MSDLTDRMAEIEKNLGGTYYRGLKVMSGTLVNAARVDLAVDGRYYDVDLRCAPFAGDEELKQLVRDARAAQSELTERLISLAFESGQVSTGGGQ